MEDHPFNPDRWSEGVARQPSYVRTLARTLVTVANRRGEFSTSQRELQNRAGLKTLDYANAVTRLRDMGALTLLTPGVPGVAGSIRWKLTYVASAVVYTRSGTVASHGDKG